MPWLTTAQASHRLGVKPPTLYAYVSRGLLHSHRDPVTGHSRFETREVEQLALRGRPRQASRARSLDLQIDTRITQIAGHTIRYRGHDILALARGATFEQVADLLWTGELSAPGRTWQSRTLEPGLSTSSLTDLRMADRLRLITAHDAIGASLHRDPETVTETGRGLVATLIDALPLAGGARAPRLVLPDGTVVRDAVAARLWIRLTPRRASPALMAVMNAALVLLADHEMAASTLAARVAASTRAGVHDVVAAGMGTLNGPLHGGESQRVRRVLRTAVAASVRSAVAEAVEHHGRLPGFGQVLYPEGDPRATLLLHMLRDAGTHPALAVVDELIEEAALQRLPRPNVDLALGVLGMIADMPDDAGTAIFAPARVVGWLAHAMEEYDEQPLRFRPRAVYVGPSTQNLSSA